MVLMKLAIFDTVELDYVFVHGKSVRKAYCTQLYKMDIGCTRWRGIDTTPPERKWLETTGSFFSGVTIEQRFVSDQGKKCKTFFLLLLLLLLVWCTFVHCCTIDTDEVADGWDTQLNSYYTYVHFVHVCHFEWLLKLTTCVLYVLRCVRFFLFLRAFVTRNWTKDSMLA